MAAKKQGFASIDDLGAALCAALTAKDANAVRAVFPPPTELASLFDAEPSADAAGWIAAMREELVREMERLPTGQVEWAGIKGEPKIQQLPEGMHIRGSTTAQPLAIWRADVVLRIHFSGRMKDRLARSEFVQRVADGRFFMMKL